MGAWKQRRAKPGGTAEAQASVPANDCMGQERFLFFLLSRNHRKEPNQHGCKQRDPLQNLSGRERDAPGMVQRPGRHEEQARPSAQPRHRPAHDRPGTGGAYSATSWSSRSWTTTTPTSPSRRRSGFLQDVPSLAPGAGLLPGGKARHPGKDLLQVRGQQHLRQPQAELRHRPGLLRQEAGPQGRDHRDRRRPVGHGPLHGLRLLWAWTARSSW